MMTTSRLRDQSGTRAVQVVLFDLDDTLTDHQYASRAGLAALQAQYPCFRDAPIRQLERDNLRLLNELYHQVLRGELTSDEARVERFDLLFSMYGQVPTGDMARAAAANHHRAYQAALRPVPGAVALLNALRPRARIIVVTNGSLSGQMAKLRDCQLETLIDHLVVSEEVGAVKPDPAIFQHALQRVDCPPDRAVMLGDAWDSDILGAHAAGIRAVWLNRYEQICPDPALATEISSLEPTDRVARILLG